MFPLGKASESLCSTANQPLAIWRITRHLLLFFFLLVVFCFHDTLNHLSLLLSETWVRASLVQSNILGLAGCNAGLNIELPVLVKELETEIKPWSKASWNQWDFFHQLQCYREENFQLALWWDHFGWPHVLSSSIKAALRVCKAQRRLCVRLCNQETGRCQVPLLSPAFFVLHNFIQVEHRGIFCIYPYQVRSWVWTSCSLGTSGLPTVPSQVQLGPLLPPMVVFCPPGTLSAPVPHCPSLPTPFFMLVVFV